MQANETTDLQEFVNGLRDQGMDDKQIAAELELRAKSEVGQAEQADAVKSATDGVVRAASIKVPAKPKAKANTPRAKAARAASPKPIAEPKATPAPKKDDGTIRIHLSDTVFKAVEQAGEWRKANARGWKALKAAQAVRAAKSIPANHYYYPVMQREDVTALATLLSTELSEISGAKRYAGLLSDQAKV